MKTASRLHYASLALCPFVALLNHAAAADGYWLGNVTNVAPNGVWTNTANWSGGTIAGGADSTAVFDFNPISDAGAAGQLAGSLIFDAPATIGNFVFNDRDVYGSATLGLNVPAAPSTVQTLTLDTTSGTPTLTTGQLLNSILGGKKVVINANVQGTDGLFLNGPGFLSFRNGSTASSISGALTIQGSALQQQSLFPSITGVSVSGGGTLVLDFAAGGATNKFAASTPLTLGGALGSGSLLNINAAATSTQSQTFNGVTLNEGANLILLTTNTNQNTSFTLGAFTRNAGATLNMNKPTAAGTGTIGFTNANDAQGITGAWATWAANTWLVNNGSNAAAGFAAFNLNSWAPNNNTDITLSANLGALTTGTVRFNTANAHQLTLSGLMTLEKGGLINAQQSNYLTGGSMTSGAIVAGKAELYMHVGGPLRLNADVVDNGATPLLLIKSLPGNLFIERDLSHTGGTILGAGTITVGKGPQGGSAGSLGTGSILLSSQNSNNGANNPSGVLVVNRSGSYTIPNSINAGGHAGGFLAQAAGGGTLVIDKQANVAGFQQLAGTTTLNFNGAGAPASQMLNAAYTTGPATLHTGRFLSRNGSFNMQGKDGVATSQDFSLVEIQGHVNYGLTPGAGGTVNLGLGSFSKTVNAADAGGSVNIDMPAGATATSYSGNANTIITNGNSAYVSINKSEWAAKDATNTQLVPGSSIPGFYTAPAGAISIGNVDVTAGDNVTGAIGISSLRFNQATGGDVLLNAGAAFRPNGILVSPSVTTATTISGAGDLRANTGNSDLPILQNSGSKLTISAIIANFDATNLTHLAKSGSGELELTNAANSYTGRTFVNAGTLRLSGSGNIGTSAVRGGSVFVRQGELIIQDSAKSYNGTFVSVGQRQGENGALTVKNNGILDVAADFNVGDVNAKGVLTVSDSASLVIKSFYVGKVGYAEGTVNQTGGTISAGNTPTAEWNLGGNGATDSASLGTYNLSGTATFSPLAQTFQVGRWGTGVMNVSGNAQVTGTGFHATGRFNTGVGTLNLSNNAIYNVAPGGAGANIYIVGEVGRGNLNISDSAALTAKNMSIAHSGGYGVVNQTGGTVDLINTAAYTQGGPANVQAGVVFGMVVAPTVFQPDYGGVYNLAGGTLKTFGVAKSPGTVATAAFHFDGGVIQAKANNTTFLQGLNSSNVKAGGAKVDTNTFNIAVNQNLKHDTALGLTQDGGLTKSGNGILTLGGTGNDYTGATAVTAGTLMLGASDVLPNSSALSLSAGTTLATGGNDDTTGALNLLGNAIIDMGTGSGSELTFADLPTGWVGALSIWNYNGAPWTAGTDKLIFSANTNAQTLLSSVNFYSDAGTTLVGTSGGAFIGTELVPVPEPSTLAGALLLLAGLGWKERRSLLHRR